MNPATFRSPQMKSLFTVYQSYVRFLRAEAYAPDWYPVFYCIGVYHAKNSTEAGLPSLKLDQNKG